MVTPVNAMWFSPKTGRFTGLVLGRDEETDEVDAYICTALGVDESEDMEWVIKHGQKVSVQSLKDFLDQKLEQQEYECDECKKPIGIEDVGYLGPADRTDESCNPFMGFACLCTECESKREEVCGSDRPDCEGNGEQL